MIGAGATGGRCLRTAEPSPLRHLVRQMQDVRRRLDRIDPPACRPLGRPRLRLLTPRGSARW